MVSLWELNEKIPVKCLAYEWNDRSTQQMPWVTPHALYTCPSSSSVLCQLDSLAHSYSRSSPSPKGLAWPSQAGGGSLHNCLRVSYAYLQHSTYLPGIIVAFLSLWCLGPSRVGSVLGHLYARGLGRVWPRANPWWGLSKGQKGQGRTCKIQDGGGMPSVSAVLLNVLSYTTWCVTTFRKPVISLTS